MSDVIVLPPSKIVWKLQVKHSGLCLNVMDMSQDDGHYVCQWPFGNEPNALWLFNARADGYFQIVAYHSQKCLDVAGADFYPTGFGSLDDGAQIVQATPRDVDSQLWRTVATGDDANSIYVVNKHSGKALDVREASTAAGALVCQYQLHGSDNQRWLNVEVRDLNMG